ncbi:unnamed protein product [Prorocentrum cordatum]|uniref:Pentatricopeptide repeat-containing protein n=1 Tax=Prorocentrum cordatum TaxID=2364126 RepID=A0ABN9QKW7_9DINO|nr:unnamed protein product [Polarella glacialis]
MQEVKLEPNVMSYNAGISACEKGEQWQRALELLGKMQEVKLEPSVITYNAGIVACRRCGQWQQALSLLGEMRNSYLEPNDNSYNLGITAYEMSSRHLVGLPGYLQVGLSRFRAS